jgi:hypothetical protein
MPEISQKWRGFLVYGGRKVMASETIIAGAASEPRNKLRCQNIPIVVRHDFGHFSNRKMKRKSNIKYGILTLTLPVQSDLEIIRI